MARASCLSIVRTGIKNGEINSHVDPKGLVTVVISSLEGALMISRLNRDREALRVIQTHLEQYLDSEVRVRKA